MTPGTGVHEIRPFRTLSDYRGCVALQEATWGDGFSERVPTAILRVSQRLGGISAGAYDANGELVGFVFGMTGVDEHGLVHWSDMLAVRPDRRDTGLGRRLKAYQRMVLLERGVSRMIWTFDPLQSRNAYLNFRHLGAISQEYERDMYGQTDSPLHQGIGTDRLLALWLMDTERVAQRLSDEPVAEPVGLEHASVALGHTDGPHPRPAEPNVVLDAPVLRVAIPADLDSLKRDDLPLAVAWRKATRAALEAYLDRSYEARELVRDGVVSHYLLVKRTIDES